MALKTTFKDAFGSTLDTPRLRMKSLILYMVVKPKVHIVDLLLPWHQVPLIAWELQMR